MPTRQKSSENGAGFEEKDRQIQRLKGQVAALKKQLAAAQTKADQYREQISSWVRARFPREELERFAREVDETDCQPLEQFMGELEAIVHKRKNGA